MKGRELQMQYAQLVVPGNCPEGMYLSMAGDGEQLPGVIFVRKGYYQGCILHFKIVFQNGRLPPTVHFDKGSIVHPLVDPSNDRLSIASAFPSWDHRAHNLTKLLYFIKGVFKTHFLDSLNEGLVTDAEAWRIVFSKLAAQCAVVSASPSTLYKESGQAPGREVGTKSTKSLYSSGISFRQMDDEELQEVRQAIFAD